MNREPNLIMGVDPGFSGAIAVFDPDANLIIEVIDMPTTAKSQGAKMQIVVSELAEFVLKYAIETRLALIEDVGSRPGQGVTSMFRFGFATGIVHGVIASHHIPIHQTRPSIWKANLGLNKEKHHAVEKAKHLFPKAASQFLASKDGRAEAALLAYFGKRIPTN